jgi:hypothetical protein
MDKTRNTIRYICKNLQDPEWCGVYHWTLETALKHAPSNKPGWSVREVDYKPGRFMAEIKERTCEKSSYTTRT